MLLDPSNSWHNHSGSFKSPEGGQKEKKKKTFHLNELDKMTSHKDKKKKKKKKWWGGVKLITKIYFGEKDGFYWTYILSDQIRLVAQSCPTLCDPMNRSTPGLPVHNQLPEFTQTHVHWVSDAIQPSHTLSSPSPPAPNPSQHQSLFQWVNSSHEVAKVLEFQL